MGLGGNPTGLPAIDKELEQAGYRFVRYADDFIVMVKSQEELPNVLGFVTDVVENKLELKLSKDKTELTDFKRGFRFLGYDFLGRYKSISQKSLDKLKDNLRHRTRRSQGVNLKAVISNINPVIRGHVNYFRLGDVQTTYRNLDC